MIAAGPPPGIPFGHLNLRRNPFGALPDEAWAQVVLPAFELEPVIERLGRPGYCLQLMGDSGRGKSSHLRMLHASFANEPWTYVAEGTRPRIPEARQVVFVDEVWRLPFWQRRTLWRRPCSFAIGTHFDHAAELRRAGVQVQTVEVGGLTPARLLALMRRRIDWARRGPAPAPVPEPTLALAQALVAVHRDDLRAIQRELYERFQRLEAPGPLAPENDHDQM